MALKLLAAWFCYKAGQGASLLASIMKQGLDADSEVGNAVLLNEAGHFSLSQGADKNTSVFYLE